MSERFQAIKAGLIVTAAAISFYAFVFASPHIIKATGKPQQLPSWSTDKIRAEMGEANQVMDGSSLGFPQGTTCRVWVQQARAFILCTA